MNSCAKLGINSSVKARSMSRVARERLPNSRSLVPGAPSDTRLNGSDVSKRNGQRLGEFHAAHPCGEYDAQTPLSWCHAEGFVIRTLQEAGTHTREDCHDGSIMDVRQRIPDGLINVDNVSAGFDTRHGHGTRLCEGMTSPPLACHRAPRQRTSCLAVCLQKSVSVMRRRTRTRCRVHWLRVL